jgi:hypothetical protein
MVFNYMVINESARIVFSAFGGVFDGIGEMAGDGFKSSQGYGRALGCDTMKR